MYKQTIRPYPLMVRLHQCLGRSFRKQVPAAHKSYLPNLHDKHILYTVHNAQLTRFTLNSPLTVWFNTDGRHRTIWACLASSMYCVVMMIVMRLSRASSNRWFQILKQHPNKLVLLRTLVSFLMQIFKDVIVLGYLKSHIQDISVPPSQIMSIHLSDYLYCDVSR